MQLICLSQITLLLQCSFSCTVHCVIPHHAFLFSSTTSLGSKVEDKKKKKSWNNIPNKLLLTITIQHGHINGTLKKIEFVEN